MYYRRNRIQIGLELQRGSEKRGSERLHPRHTCIDEGEAIMRGIGCNVKGFLLGVTSFARQALAQSAASLSRTPARSGFSSTTDNIGSLPSFSIRSRTFRIVK